MILIGLIQLITALGALPAGWSLIVEPKGTGIGLANEILLNSPFQNFFLPGLFLFIVLGIFNALGAYFTFKRSSFTAQLGVGLGVILVIWICVQVYFIGLTHFLQILFLLLGLIEIALSLYLNSRAKP